MQQMYDMVIIGGGPGGIGAAVEAKVLGINSILMIEKGDNHSQTIRKFYKDNKRVDKNYKGQEIELHAMLISQMVPKKVHLIILIHSLTTMKSTPPLTQKLKVSRRLTMNFKLLRPKQDIELKM